MLFPVYLAGGPTDCCAWFSLGYIIWNRTDCARDGTACLSPFWPFVVKGASSDSPPVRPTFYFLGPTVILMEIFVLRDARLRGREGRSQESGKEAC